MNPILTLDEPILEDILCIGASASSESNLLLKQILESYQPREIFIDGFEQGKDIKQDINTYYAQAQKDKISNPALSRLTELLELLGPLQPVKNYLDVNPHVGATGIDFKIDEKVLYHNKKSRAFIAFERFYNAMIDILDDHGVVFTDNEYKYMTKIRESVGMGEDSIHGRHVIYSLDDQTTLTATVKDIDILRQIMLHKNFPQQTRINGVSFPLRTAFLRMTKQIKQQIRGIERDYLDELEKIEPKVAQLVLNGPSKSVLICQPRLLEESRYFASQFRDAAYVNLPELFTDLNGGKSWLT